MTGASDGIGQEVARGLARSGARVILACRDPARGAAAREDILASAGPAEVELRLVDFSSASSIRAFAAGVLESHPKLHVLVNNAGGWSTTRRIAPDGHELTWATNMMGYFLTTRLLEGRLRASAPARVVNVASDLAYGLDLTDVSFARRPYDGVAAYAQSKQANRMWTWALARRLAGSGVTANAVHPGGVRTGIFRKAGGALGWMAHVLTGVVGRSPSRGADTVLWLAASAEVEGRSGEFFVDRRARACRFRNVAAEEELWALCETMAALPGGETV